MIINPHRVLYQDTPKPSTRHIDPDYSRNNRCNTCKLADVTSCPLQSAAFEKHGWHGLEKCEMGDAIDKLLTAAREDGRFLNSRDGKRTA